MRHGSARPLIGLRGIEAISWRHIFEAIVGQLILTKYLIQKMGREEAFLHREE